MRKKFFGNLIVVLILLVGCTSFKDDEYNQDYDYQYMYFSSNGSHDLYESDNGYYYLLKNNIYYSDKESDNSIILCNKPNCDHNNQECDGYSGYFPEIAPIIYNDNIYYVNEYLKGEESYLSLFKADLDGTNKKEILYFSTPVNDFIIHRGKVYFSTMPNGVDSGIGVYAYDLKKDKLETVYEDNDNNTYILSLYAYKNNLYFEVSKTDEKYISHNEVYNYNIKNNKVDKFPVYDDGISRPVALNDKLYFYSYNGSEGIEYITDLDGKIVKKNEVKEIRQYYSDLEYIYKLFEDKNKLEIYNTENELLKEVYFENFDLSENIVNFTPGNERTFIYYKNIENPNIRGIKYIDKEELLSGYGKVKDLLEVDYGYN